MKMDQCLLPSNFFLLTSLTGIKVKVITSWGLFKLKTPKAWYLRWSANNNILFSELEGFLMNYEVTIR